MRHIKTLDRDVYGLLNGKRMCIKCSEYKEFKNRYWYAIPNDIFTNVYKRKEFVVVFLDRGEETLRFVFSKEFIDLRDKGIIDKYGRKHILLTSENNVFPLDIVNDNSSRVINPFDNETYIKEWD